MIAERGTWWALGCGLLSAACGGGVVRTPNPASGGDAQVLTDAAGLPEASAEAAVPTEGRDAASSGSSEGGVSPGGQDDSGAPSPEGVGLFVAQGMIGRTVISCDEGRTWIHHQSMDDNAACDDPDMDCTHHTGTGLGIVHTGEWFVAVWGWGEPGPVKRSRDGVNWQTVLTGNFGGVAAGAGRVVLAAPEAQFSTNHGASFVPSDIDAIWDITGATVRRVGFAGNGNGSFLLVGNDGTQVAVTHDFGQTWVRPTQIDADCGRSITPEGGFAYANDTLVMVSYDGGYACRSLDGGRTFTRHNMPDEVSSNIVWDGEAFVGYAQGKRVRSPDGATWTATAITPGNLKLGAIARSDTGVYVGVGWAAVRNSDVRFYRSEDGLQWQALDPKDYPAGQPITAIAFGRAPAATVCSAQ